MRNILFTLALLTVSCSAWADTITLALPSPDGPTYGPRATGYYYPAATSPAQAMIDSIDLAWEHQIVRDDAIPDAFDWVQVDATIHYRYLAKNCFRLSWRSGAKCVGTSWRSMAETVSQRQAIALPFRLTFTATFNNPAPASATIPGELIVYDPNAMPVWTSLGVGPYAAAVSLDIVSGSFGAASLALIYP